MPKVTEENTYAYDSKATFPQLETTKNKLAFLTSTLLQIIKKFERARLEALNIFGKMSHTAKKSNWCPFGLV